eukprot:CAMPEP_0117586854 /NCGR_PEP_ID=MMETSP0784-20121206/68960_1 /TAXON_ID=39447 /ORGANISM="" /LENGTH=62 /DNA_ID=CAMNT_0005388015 /DNA_START=20 /DNA_END=204 /DNA_ORIENTATION=+
MERKRQKYCAATGAVLLMVAGVLVLAVWQLVSSSGAMRVLASSMCAALLAAGTAVFAVGALG